MKNLAKMAFGIGILMLPYIAMQSCEQNTYGLLKNQREYFECAGLRKVENRTKVLDLQHKIYEHVKDSLKKK